MEIDKIITLASSEVQLQFLAMERSLRAAGCDLPLWVIPYNNHKFELPFNSQWWEIKEITHWLDAHQAHPMMRKYQCLTVANYQFVDSDVVFISNPHDVLKKATGFVTSCGHWHNPGHTYTNQSLKILKENSTVWQKNIFNAGQFACDKILYTIPDLKEKAESENFKYTCLQLPYHDQPGLNLLVNTSGVSINNLTLPPFNMESTWAGDYNEVNFNDKWKEQNKPYLIHWAGCVIDGGRKIDELFLDKLTEVELSEWKINNSKNFTRGNGFWQNLKKLRSKLGRIYKIVKE